MITDMTWKQDMILVAYNHNAQVSATTVLLHSQLCGARGEECASRLPRMLSDPKCMLEPADRQLLVKMSYSYLFNQPHVSVILCPDNKQIHTLSSEVPGIRYST